MPKINEYININKKLVEIVQEVPRWEEFEKNWQAGEKANYADLRHSDIGDTKGYGPCEYSDCPYSSRFFSKIVFKRNWHFKLPDGYRWRLVFNNVQEAHDRLRSFERDESIVDDDDMKETEAAKNKKREAMIKIQDYIDSHERGERVYEPKLDLSGNDKPCIQS
ncbi:MAG: hypothetical protein MRERC_12c027 [Mycoplasmataceae bacterium RC_NB112A]|nr:MAG: hypothetical protein MRERC_12c027 [Mycoplasmataceae bacterium RC_NB112A]